MDNERIPENTVDQYQVVARRYRPQGFSELVGQDHVAQALSNAIQTGRIGHAYLFTGARGVGKTSSARIFAKALNCVDGPTITSCNQCEICVSVSTGEDVDVLEIDGASNRGIDEIRQLRQNASVKPSRARYKIYIIDEVHMLTREAFNALLKTLEEPPGHVKFIFCTTEPSKIPITILSRCQRFDFAGIDMGAIAERLALIAQNEGVTAEDGVFETLSRRASGSMRDAQSLLEQLLSFAPEHIALKDVHEMLGTADDQRVFRILQAIIDGNAADIFQELDAASQEGVDFGVFAEQLMGIFRDLMVSASGGDKNLLLYCPLSRYDDVKRMARQLELPRILAALQILDQAYTKMRYSTQGRILLELALARIGQLEQLKSIATLLEQLKSGEIAFSAVPQQPPQISKPVPSITTPKSVPDQKKTDDLIAPMSNPEPVQMELSEKELPRLWDEATRNLPLMAASQASMAQSFRFEPPNMIVVIFPSTQALAQSYCEKELARFQAKLTELVGRPVQIRFDTVLVQEEPKKVVKRLADDSGRKYRNMAEAEDHPLVKKAGELFGAKITDVQES